MGKDQTQGSRGSEHSSTKRRRRNNLFDNYIHAIAEQIGSHNHGSSESQNAWLMTVERLRKEVLNCRDLNRAHTDTDTRVLANAPHSSSSSSSYFSQCSLCKNNEAMAQTMCSQFLCWECLCKQDMEGPPNKACPCCDTIETKSHITFIEKKPELNHRMDVLPLGLTPFHGAVETISNPPASFDQQPTCPTSLIVQLDPCSSAQPPSFSDDVSTNIELNTLPCNAEHSSWMSVQRLMSADVDPPFSDALTVNIGPEGGKEAVDMRWTQAEEVLQCTSSSKIIAADNWEAEGILNVRDLDSVLDENIFDWSLLEEILSD